MIQQEYYVSFQAANSGHYYGKWLEQAYSDGRVLDFDIDPKLPVYTFWDLGVADATAIWLMQYVSGELRLIAYYENSGEGLPFYIDWLKKFQLKYRIKFADHFAPHDIEVRELTSGKSRRDIARTLGINFRKAPKIGVMDGIESARILFDRFWFHKTNCKLGIEALAEYHKEYDVKNKVYKDHPKHDWTSHAADALRYLAISWKEYFANKMDVRPVSYKQYIP